MNIVPTQNKTSNTKIMKPFIFKIAIIMAAALILSLLVIANSIEWKMICFSDQLTCTKNRISVVIEKRDAEMGVLQEQSKKIQDTILSRSTYWETQIDQEKRNLPAGYVSDMIKKQDFKDVPKGILESVIPKVNADNGEQGTASDQTSSPKDSLSTAEDTSATGVKAIAERDTGTGSAIRSNGIRFAEVIPVGRYGKVLAELGSPYAALPIEQYCNENGLGQRQCDLLLGVAQRESQNGTDFNCDYKTKSEANKLGQDYYHNPAGFKDLRPEGERERPTPDENGCYLRRFDSWEAFWRFYIPHMMRPDVYNWGKVTDVTYLSGCYVKGHDKETQACLPPAYDWVNTVHGFAEKVQQSNS